MVLIKKFMIKNSTSDMRIRMLRVDDLLRIQGFSNGCILRGTQKEQKKCIGNSVHPIIAKRWVECMYQNSNIKCLA